VATFCGQDENAAVERGAPFIRLPRGRLRWTADRGLRSLLTQLILRSDGVHIHGIWEEHCAVAAALAAGVRKPYIISAHGMLEGWAVRSKWLKKAVYSALFEKRNLRRASCLRALTRTEVDDYRRLGIQTPVAVVPNGVDPPDELLPEPFLQLHPGLRGKRVVLFLSRLHPKKGLDLLCLAWAELAHRFEGSHLVIAGPDDGARRNTVARVADLGINETVLFTGMLETLLKWSALATATVFVLPSRSEGFSVAVLEAMAAGVPVIITRQCNFPEVAEAGCGWVIEPDAQQLRQALEACLGAPAAELARMGAAAQALVQERYTWPVVGRQMSEVYEWILGGRLPTTVELY
jgi:glycosyltransferase involved in cell wall biosynthesis